MNKSNHTELCFIGGSGRSGTTLLRRIFDLHPSAISMPEYHITIDPGGLIDFYLSLQQNWSPYVFDDRLKRLEKTLKAAESASPLARYYHYAFRRSILAKVGRKFELKYMHIGIERYCPKYGRMVDRLIEDLREFEYGGCYTGMTFGERNRIYFGEPPEKDRLSDRLGTFYREMANCIAEEHDSTHFVEDNVWNILYFNRILELLPEAKLVHIYRDPRDVVASYTQQSWMPSDPVEAARAYTKLMDRWEDVKAGIPDNAYIEVALEDLVENPKSRIGEVATFWDLDWDDALLGMDLSKSHSGRWKRDISRGKQEKVISLLKPYLDRFGYVSDL